MTAIVDRIESATDRIREDDDDFLADKKRFESFRLGGGSVAPLSQTKRHSHSRSHSRNVSISISPSPPLSLASSSHDLSFSSSSSIVSLSQSASTPSVASKRNSHHRRRSSVSTRRESAEVMGVALPALSTSNSEDNMSLGDKDSIRRRALWVLEGKPTPDGFSPVEIPELSTPEIERRISELPSKPSFPPAIGSFIPGLSGLTNMRDSFSSRMSSSIKDQLHTLVEEEEEEEELNVPLFQPSASQCESPAGVVTSPATVTTSPSPARHRPAVLNLRPLSLSPDKLMSAANGELPTPAPTPTPSKPSGLKSLTLTTSPPLISSPPATDGVSLNATAANRRSVVVPPTHTSSSSPFFRRGSLTDSASSISWDPFEVPRKRSSISYKPSFHGLPTPELTPTTERRASTGSDSDWGRPPSLLSNEQHFLYQSHAALVARISELERTLCVRTQPRSVLLATSDNTSNGPEPTDEMLRLIADLKAERDELKRDIDGWRKRVTDLQEQTTVLMHRIDTERQEAWLAREQLGLLKIERQAAVRAAEESDAALGKLQAELAATNADFRAMKEEADQRDKEMANEFERVESELSKERRRREELEKALAELSLLNTPTPVVSACRVMSNDSMSSATDVESLDDHIVAGPELKVVQEVDEDEETDSDQENNLMGYEDEEEGDEGFTSQDGSSFSSLEDIPHPTVHLVPSVASSPSRTPSPASLPAHARHSSLSREWSFPAKGTPHAASPQHVPEEVDRFFGCLEDIGDSPPTSAAGPDTANPFTKGFFGAVEEAEDELPPFVLPADVGIEIESPPAQNSAPITSPGLGVVHEEDELEDTNAVEFVGEEDEGGITFTFKVPPASPSPASSQTPSPTTPQVSALLAREPIPYYEPASEDDDETAFSFPATFFVPRMSNSPPSPSAIPRATILKRFEGPAKEARFSPPRASPSPPTALAHVTPLSRRGSARPSFIPQPTTKTTFTPPTFIPQPTTRTGRITSSMSPNQSQSQPPRSPSSGAATVNTNTSASPRPLTALQSLASLMPPLSSPFSWSGMRVSLSSAENPSNSSDSNSKGERELKKGFVSKDRQLAKLRERMVAEEKVAVVDGHEQQIAPCKRCVDRVVSP
ncbi:hypothetical protein B0F90DRAFT_1747672 [Multifurca ochricompacta]|uniref:Uncharacterized protein n=1 Tax=Multifurca ochricompacta TaxID=376703 RepID=A0AAD4M0T6_9AGAM|nr:hypothetical protein B0F90DRAFT_1747672 [Multifurca ochricompacta]